MGGRRDAPGVVVSVSSATAWAAAVIMWSVMRRARVFAGYAGWGPGQLEAELEEQSWLVEPAAGVDLFPERGEDLWAIVVNRKGGAHRALALMPEDPSLN